MRRQIIGSGTLLASANAFAILCSFARNIIIARIIGPDDFGVAVLILTMATAADLLSDMGWDRFLVQGGDEARAPNALSIVHRIRMVTGMAAAVLIMLAAPALAHLVEAPEAALPLALVGLVCLIRAAVNSDFRLAQRELHFRGEAIVETSKALTDLIIGIAAALILGTYWAMLCAVAAGAVAAFIASHAVARTRYTQAWDAVIGKAALAFGTPLLANNIVIFGAGHFDRILVGAGLSTATLGTYAAGATIAAGAQAVTNRTSISLGMPLLSAVTSDAAAYAARFRLAGVVISSAALLLILGAALVGSDLIRLLFGAAFQPEPMMVAGIGLAAAFNILRIWPSIGLMAHGKTKTLPLANMVRLVGPILAALALAQGHGVVAVTFCLAGGELLGLISALGWHWREIGGRVGDLILIPLALIIGAGITLWLTTLFANDLGSRLILLAVGTLLVAGYAAAMGRGAASRGTNTIF